MDTRWGPDEGALRDGREVHRPQLVSAGKIPRFSDSPTRRLRPLAPLRVAVHRGAPPVATCWILLLEGWRQASRPSLGRSGEPICPCTVYRSQTARTMASTLRRAPPRRVGARSRPFPSAPVRSRPLPLPPRPAASAGHACARPTPLELRASRASQVAAPRRWLGLMGCAIYQETPSALLQVQVGATR